MPVELFKKEAPKVAETYFESLGALKEYSSILDTKTCELLLIAALVATRSLGIDNHIKGAKEKGISDSEIIAAIILTLPICGIGTVMHGLDIAKKVLDI